MEATPDPTLEVPGTGPGPATTGSGLQFLTFLMAGEEYGVNILRVQEIKGWQGATPIPNTPDYVMGVINLRGAIVPVMDLRRRFGLEFRNYTATTVVIVLAVRCGQGERVMGIVVDAVSDVYNISSERQLPAPECGGGSSEPFICGLAAVDEKMVILLDIDRLLTGEELARIEQSANGEER